MLDSVDADRFCYRSQRFIGSTLVDALLADGKTVIGWDNFSTGRLEFLQ